MLDANTLVKVGGIAPANAKTDEDATVTLVAKPFRHGALGDRVVVRLVEGTLEPAVDAEMGVLGFAASGDAEVVGKTKRRALGFPAWALVNHPKDARFALEVMKDFRKAAKRIKAKPGHAKEEFVAIEKKLERTVPSFLPSFWEEAGRCFLEQESQAFAAQCFEKARSAERAYKLKVDEDRRAEAYLEFALAGAVPTKSLQGYAGDLVKAFGAKEAERRYRELNVHRIKGGIAPFTGLGKELRKLAKEAKRKELEADFEFLQEVLSAPSLAKAPTEFWTTYRAPLLALAKDDAAARDKLVWLFPKPKSFAKFLPTWLSFLDDLAAAAHVAEPAAASRFLTELTKFIAYSDEWGNKTEPPLAAYFTFLSRLAPAAKVAGPVALISTDRWGSEEYASDVLEAGLDLELELAPPKDKEGAFDLRDAFARDPVKVAAHPVFGPRLQKAVENVFGEASFEERAKGKLGFKAARKAVLLELVRKLDGGGVVDALSALGTLKAKTKPEVFAEFPEAKELLDRVRIAPILARSLRGGIVDELAWPEYEAALAELAGPKVTVSLHGTARFPVLRAGTKVIVFEGKKRLRSYDVPPGIDPSEFLYLDGDLLVTGNDATSHERVLYWCGSGKSIPGSFWISGIPEDAPLARGGITLGKGVIRAGEPIGDKTGQETFLTDGTTFWRSKDEEGRLKLFEFDPETGAAGRASWPDFVKGASERTDGFSIRFVSLRKMEGATGSMFGAKDGLAGGYVCAKRAKSATGADGANEAADDEESGTAWERTRIDGVRWTGTFSPDALWSLPGGDGALATLDVSTGWSNTGDDQITVQDDARRSLTHYGQYKWKCATFARMPRLPWLHYTEPRDLDGSRALRALTDDVAEELLGAARKDDPAMAAVSDDDEDDDATPGTDVANALTLAAIQSALPAMRDEGLRRGVAAVVAYGYQAEKALGALTAAAVTVSGVTDDAVEAAFPWAGIDFGYRDGFVLPDMDVVAKYFAGGEPGKLSGSRILWDRDLAHWPLALAFLMIRPKLEDAHRATLRELAAGVAESALLGQSFVRAELVVKSDSPFLTRPKGATAWLAREGDARMFARIEEDEDEPVRKVTVLSPAATFVVPKDATLSKQAAFTVPSAGELLKGVLREEAARGPATAILETATVAAAAGSLGCAEAAYALLGFPELKSWRRDDFLGKEGREPLQLKRDEVRAAKEHWKELGAEKLFALVSEAADVKDASELWDPASAGAALARSAKNLLGTSVRLPEDLVLAVDKELSPELPARKLLPLLLDQNSPYLTPRKGPVRWNDLNDSGEHFSGDVLESVAALIPYLAHTLPVGDEFRAAVPSLYKKVMELLEAPELLFRLPSKTMEDAKKRAALFEQFGGTTTEVLYQRDEKKIARDDGVILAVDDGHYEIEYAIRTKEVHRNRARLKALLVGDEIYGDGPGRALYYLTSNECKELVLRIEASPVKPGNYEANPLASAPKTVAAVKKEHSLEDEAAALYLQTLTLPSPTARFVSLVNGWTPATYKKAAAALAKKKSLVVEGKRERAGRDLFLPGGWEKRGDTPLETYKLAFFDPVAFEEPVVSEPVHALYDRAYKRVSSGDIPRFEDTSKKKPEPAGKGKGA